MPKSRVRKQRDQPPTYFSIAGVAHRLRLHMPSVADRLVQLVASASSQVNASASSQIGTKPSPNIDGIGFVLADATPVMLNDCHVSFRIGLVVSVLGMHSRSPVYPEGTKQVNFVIAWEDARDRQFARCVPDIIVKGKCCPNFSGAFSSGVRVTSPLMILLFP